MQSEEELEYGFIVLWEIMENQSSLFEGHEADVFSRLLRIRYCNKTNVRHSYKYSLSADPADLIHRSWKRRTPYEMLSLVGLNQYMA